MKSIGKFMGQNVLIDTDDQTISNAAIRELDRLHERDAKLEEQENRSLFKRILRRILQ